MDKLTIDSEAAQKIVSTFQQLKLLENALDKEPFSEWRVILGSAKELNQSLNLALHQTSPTHFKSILSEVITKTQKQKQLLDQLAAISTDEIKLLLDQIIENMKHVHSKITIEQY